MPCGQSAFSALTLLVGRQEGHPACKKTERWGAGVVICLERGADLHTAQLMPLPLTVSCSSKIQIGFTFLVPAHLGSPGKGPLNGVCVCVPCGQEIDRQLRAPAPRTSCTAGARQQLRRSTALNSTCGQCRVNSRGTRLDTDLFIHRVSKKRH